MWEYERERGGWLPMRPEDNEVLEEASATDPHCKVNVGSNGQYVVDLATFLQQSSKTGKSRKVRRHIVQGHEKVVYLMRHGQSEANATSGGSRIVDPALTEKGREQARAWAQTTINWGVGSVLVSPLFRTLESACLAFSHGTAPIQVTRCAREHGWHEPSNQGSPLEQLKARMRNSNECSSAMPRLRGLHKLAEVDKYWDPKSEPDLPRNELRRRQKSASKYLLHKILNGPSNNVACVCHYNVAFSICGIRLHNAEVAMCLFENDAAGNWNLIRVDKLQVPEPSDVESVAPAPSPVAAILPSSLSTDVDSDSGNIDVDSLKAAAEQFICSGSSSEEELPLFGNRPRSASVLVVGRSERLNGSQVVLLGGGMGRDQYRFCDFGGGLDGGPRRYGGKQHAAQEREKPELGAFRELAEELLGLHGDAARQVSAAWCQKAQLIGDRPVVHRRHLIFVCLAEPLAEVLEVSMPSVRGDKTSAIDHLANLFKPNSEVNSISLVSIPELLSGARKELVAPASPVWGWRGRDDRLHFYSFHQSIALEHLQHIPSQMLLVQGRHRRYSVNPSKLEQKDLDRECSMQVFRMGMIRLRHGLTGPRGSIATLANTLQTWASQCRDQPVS